MLCIIELILGIHAFISLICGEYIYIYIYIEYVEGSIGKITSDIQLVPHDKDT